MKYSNDKSVELSAEKFDLTKIFSLLLTLVFLVFPNVLNAQTVYASGKLVDSIGTDLNSKHVLFVSVTTLMSEGDERLDASFTLSEGEISTWSDYSISVRFNNHRDEYIDARNGDGFEADSQIVVFFDQLYYLWIEIDVPTKIYSVSIDNTEDQSGLIKLASDFSFRKNDIEKLIYWNVLIQENSYMVVSRIALVESIGQMPGEESNLQLKNTTKNPLVYPNPFNDKVEIEMEGEFNYSVYNLNGNLILKGSSFGNCLIGEDLVEGLYLLKINQKYLTKIIKLAKTK